MPFNPGTNGTLKSTTLPAAILEVTDFLLDQEQALGNDNPNRVSFNIDLVAKTATIAVTLPISQSINSSGQPVIVAENYILEAGGTGVFNNGGGDLNSVHSSAAFLELASLLENAEVASNVNPKPDKIAIVHDINSKTSNISVTLSINSSRLSTGKLELAASNYL